MKAFEEGTIGRLTLKNRFVHSPTYEGLAAPDGSCTPELIDFNREIAKGGVGINTVSFAFIHDSGRHLPGQIGIHSDDMIPGLTKMAEAIHEEGAKSVYPDRPRGASRQHEIFGSPSHGADGHGE